MIDPTASQNIDDYLASLEGWKQQNLTHFRSLVHDTMPSVVEDWKWDVPVFLVGGKLVCAMSTFTGHTKYNFFRGAEIADPNSLFNSGLESKRSRSINVREGETIDEQLLRDLLERAGKLI